VIFVEFGDKAGVPYANTFNDNKVKNKAKRVVALDLRKVKFCILCMFWLYNLLIFGLLHD